MKKTLFFISIGVFTTIIACKNVDETLVKEMEQSAAVAEQMQPQTEVAKTDLIKLEEKFKGMQLPDSSSNMAKYVTAKLTGKFNATMEEYEKSKKEIADLKAAYEAGKMDKVEADQKYAVLKNKIDNFENSFKKMSTIANRSPEELMQMGKEIAKGEGIDLSKPNVSQDQVGGDVKISSPDQGGNAVPADGGNSLQGDGTQKKKGN